MHEMTKEREKWIVIKSKEMVVWKGNENKKTPKREKWKEKKNKKWNDLREGELRREWDP